MFHVKHPCAPITPRATARGRANAQAETPEESRGPELARTRTKPEPSRAQSVLWKAPPTGRARHTQAPGPQPPPLPPPEVTSLAPPSFRPRRLAPPSFRPRPLSRLIPLRPRPRLRIASFAAPPHQPLLAPPASTPLGGDPSLPPRKPPQLRCVHRKPLRPRHYGRRNPIPHPRCCTPPPVPSRPPQAPLRPIANLIPHPRTPGRRPRLASPRSPILSLHLAPSSAIMD